MASREDRNQDLLNAIESAEAESYGSEHSGGSGNLSDERAAALDAYFGLNTNPAPEGNSQVVSRDVFDTIEWILPSLVRIFAGTDEVVKFKAVSKEDEPAARQETLYVNHVVTQRNQWTQTFHDWAWDALVTKNAYCMAYWDDAKQVEYETYARQSDDAFALLMEDADDIEVLEHSAEQDEDTAKELAQAYAMQLQQWQMGMQQMGMQWQQAAAQAQAQGAPPPPEPQYPPQPTPPPEPMLHTVKLRRTENEGKVCLRVLPPERCVVHQQTPDYTLDKCDFFEYWEDVSISSLRQMGLKVNDDIDAAERGVMTTQEDSSRDRFGEDQSQPGWEPAMRKVRLRMCWIRHDYDDDGISELQFVMVVGRNVLYRDECNRIPVGSIVATPVPHRHLGVSIAEVVMEIAETKQAMLRQGIDNLFHANNPRTFINDDKVNLDDALVTRPGGVVRGVQGQNAEFGRDIAVLQIPNIFPQAVQGMEYMDRLAERRTGVNGVFSGNVSPEVLTQTTGMAMSQMGSAAAQKVEQIARMIAPSVEYLFGCVHELILKHGHKRETVQLAGEWTVIDPSNWRKRKDLKIAVGLGSGNKDAVLGHLSQMFQMQMALLPMGVTEPKLIYNTVSEISKMSGFGSPDLFWKLPGPPQQPPPPPEVIKEQMRQQFETQQADADRKFEVQKIQQTWQYEQQQAAMQQRFEAQSQDTELSFKQWAEQFKAQSDGEKVAMQEQNKADIAQLQAQNAQTIALIQGYLTASQSAMDAQIASGQEETSRMKTERALAKELGKALEGLASKMDGSRTVAIQKIKGPDGKMIGGRVISADGTSRDVGIQ
jgi:hypothetical protein